MTVRSQLNGKSLPALAAVYFGPSRERYLHSVQHMVHDAVYKHCVCLLSCQHLKHLKRNLVVQTRVCLF